MDARYEFLLRRSRDTKQGGHEAWSLLSTEERVAVALVLNQADWLAEMDYSIAEAIDRAGRATIAIVPQVERQLASGTSAMTRSSWRRHLSTFSGIVAAVMLTTLLVGTESGREVLGWIYLQSTQVIDNSIHFPFPLDRFDPTCPQCM